MAYLTDEERKEQAGRVLEKTFESLKGHINLYLPDGMAKDMALVRMRQCEDWCKRSASEIGGSYKVEV